MGERLDEKGAERLAPAEEPAQADKPAVRDRTTQAEIPAPADKPVAAEKTRRGWVTRAEAVATLALACVFVSWVAVIFVEQRQAGRGIRFLPAEQAAAENLINLNDAGAPELMLLPGIGRPRAERIVNWRTEHGPFRSLDEVKKAAGMSVRDLEGIRNLVTLRAVAPEPLPEAAYVEPEAE